MFCHEFVHGNEGAIVSDIPTSEIRGNRTTTDHPPQSSGTYTPAVIEDIQVKAELGRYRIRGFGILRPRTWATFDDLTFIPCGLTRIPL